MSHGLRQEFRRLWASAPAPTSTVCLIAKNEAPYLAEWLAHYLALGFDRIVVYDNASTDRTAECVIKAGRISERVSLRSWPDVAGVSPQLSCYRHAYAALDTDWIAFFDADELLVLKRHENIGQALLQCRPNAGAIAVNWLLFGSAGELSYRDEPMQSRFRRCADFADEKNFMFKSIIRKGAAETIAHPHSTGLKPGFRYLNGDLKRSRPANICNTRAVCHSTMQLNHYVLKSHEEYLGKKAKGRANEAFDSSHKFDKFDDAFWGRHDTNNRTDDAIGVWTGRSAALREKLRRSFAASFESDGGDFSRPRVAAAE